MNEASSSVALLTLPRATVAPSTLVRRYEVASESVSSGVGPAREPRLAQRDLRGLEVAPVVREIEVVELDLFDERGELRIVEVVPPVGVRPNARFVEYGPDEALRHVARRAAEAAPSWRRRREPAERERRRRTVCYSLDSATTGSRRAALRAGAKPNTKPVAAAQLKASSIGSVENTTSMSLNSADQ